MNQEELIYLDHAAATPVDARVLAAMQPYFSERFFNPSSAYAPAVQVRRDYESAKHRIAQCIGAKPDELVMTAGATESINLAFGAVDGHVVTTAIEHHAVLAAAARHDATIVPVEPTGIVSPQVVARAIRGDTQLVSVALANNELGTIQPLREIATAVQAERQRRLESGDMTPIWLHSDASQGVGQLDVHVGRLGVDMITINAGKIYGPKQTALLWAKAGVTLAPQIVGGGQERGLRSGTESVANVIGFAAALELATDHRRGESDRLRALRDTLQSRLTEAFAGAVISGSQKRRLPGHLHISFPNLDAERLIFRLESSNILVATGSACAANRGTRSHVLTAIGLAPEVADGSLRLTLGRLTDDASIDRAARVIIDEITAEYERTGAHK